MTDLIGTRIAVLDKGWIELVDLMPHPASGVSGDLAIVNAARTSFLGESKGEESDKKLLFYLMRNKHTSPFEMVEFKFRVKAPIMVVRQWQRHRTWSYSEYSYRYSEAADEFYVPSEWRLQAADNKQGSDGEIDSLAAQGVSFQLRDHCERSYWLYEDALSRGIAREQARLFVPAFALYTTFVAKTDAHNLMHFLQLRMAPDAQYEIRVYAQAIYEHFFKPALPWTAEAFEQYVLGRKDR